MRVANGVPHRPLPETNNRTDNVPACTALKSCTARGNGSSDLIWAALTGSLFRTNTASPNDSGHRRQEPRRSCLPRQLCVVSRKRLNQQCNTVVIHDEQCKQNMLSSIKTCVRPSSNRPASSCFGKRHIRAKLAKDACLLHLASAFLLRGGHCHKKT
jgi:hypothetical protein